MCDAGGAAYLLLLGAEELQQEWSGLAEIKDLDLKLWQEPLAEETSKALSESAEAIDHQSRPKGASQLVLRDPVVRRVASCPLQGAQVHHRPSGSL